MRTIIAGSRKLGYSDLEGALAACPWASQISLVLQGCAPGIDRAARKWAKETGLPYEDWPADWDTYGKRAGFLRNGEMAKHAAALLAVWDGKSKGTQDMIRRAENLRLERFTYLVTDA